MNKRFEALICISLLIPFIFILFLEDVKAATEMTNYSANWRAYQCATVVSNACTSTSSLGDQSINTSVSTSNLNSLYLRVYDTTFEVGTTYILKYTIALNPKDFAYVSNSSKTSYKYFARPTSTNEWTEYDDIASYEVKDIESNSYQFTITFRFTPKVNSNAFMAQIGYGIYSPLNAVNVYKLEVTYEEGINSVIENQTSVIIDKTNEIIGTIKENNQQIVDQNEELIETNKGIWETLKALPETLVNWFTDMLKGLFIPTNEQLEEIIDDSQKVAENFGFIGQTTDFLINLFTGFIGVVQDKGCITLPKLELGFGGILGMSNVVLWEDYDYCMSDNEWFGTDSYGLDIVRFILTASLVLAFLNYAYNQLTQVLSKDGEHN